MSKASEKLSNYEVVSHSGAKKEFDRLDVLMEWLNASESVDELIVLRRCIKLNE
jgi:hypothetical protein